MRKAIFLFAPLFFISACDSGSQALEGSSDPRSIHDRLFVMDMHVDSIMFTNLYGTDFSEPHPPPEGFEYFIKPQADLPGLIEGGTDALWFGIVVFPLCEPEHCFDDALNTMQTAKRVISDNSDQMALALNPDDIDGIRASGKIPTLMGLEGAHGVGPQVSNVDILWSEGLRYIGLAHFTPNRYASTNLLSAIPNAGLTEDGKALIRRMNELGMIIDLAHTHPDSIRDTLAISEAPVIVSHSGVRGVYDIFRNLSDEDIKGITDAGGVIGIFFASLWLKPESPAYAEDVVNHIDYVVKTFGIDHVGIGSDFDGWVMMPEDLPSASYLPVLTERLVARGYKESQLRKLYGENMLRVFRDVTRIAGELQEAKVKNANRLVKTKDLSNDQ